MSSRVSPTASRFLEGLSFVGQGVIGKRSQVRFQGVDALDNRHQALDFSVVLAAENEVEDLRQHRDLTDRETGVAAT